MSTLFGRALFAFLALPGTVAFLVPWLIVRRGDHAAGFVWVGLAPLGLGAGLLLWCVREFYVTGRGTLAPWSPPVALVVSGPYRVSRNPMYVAVALILCGWAIGFRSTALAVYTMTVVAAFQLRIVFGEEPWLARTHGARWHAYTKRVPRWLSLRRHHSDDDD
jgi:protein-S-isoprenylcysteine O-methyltransferase Ste14